MNAETTRLRDEQPNYLQFIFRYSEASDFGERFRFRGRLGADTAADADLRLSRRPTYV